MFRVGLMVGRPRSVLLEAYVNGESVNRLIACLAAVHGADDQGFAIQEKL